MASEKIALLASLCFAALVFSINAASIFNESSSDLSGIRLPNYPGAILGDETPGCNQFSAGYNEKAAPDKQKKSSPLRVKLLHSKHKKQNESKSRKALLFESLARDRTRVDAFHQRLKTRSQSNVAEPKSDVAGYASEIAVPGPNNQSHFANSSATTATLVASVESGVSVGSGEYFMDVFIGTPPRHFSLILDTGSDLNWVQCLPCQDCYPQEGPLYNASTSSTYRPVPCNTPQCNLVTDVTGNTCNSTASTCPYFYWYGDRSNTTGELAFETFTVNLTSHAKPVAVPDILFGCGHANRGLFHGAAGLLGLGRGQLSFASQLRKHHGHKFSYCLVDRNSNLSVTSTLIFGEDRHLISHPDLKFTTLVKNPAAAVDTFYYLNVSTVTVGGTPVNASVQAWNIDKASGAGGLIIDSGTTLTYLAEPAYSQLKAAFEAKIPYNRTEFAPLELCYNVSGVEDVKLPEFSVLFHDGVAWKFPVENYFIQPDPDESVVCLAVLGTPMDSLSILGNYQQQNFHVLYDVDNSRLGFAPMACDKLSVK
ncbi:hypothetical protein SUGI_0092830 [Cryptomeria japonica]|uniref:aspartyl protease family protein 2 n=1 Tax=Cryptomeria japonica TaxID=3369 RepID=UPI002408A7E4|nr:aspartyl protease family protein 2 [Cryptomeria japonica]XP_057834272.2 aspartyl protease family protein 2 [Cryptomeria japonica]XP_057834273.2 aspartyl protease family protein 2 [Cryptomeria japonica]XP_057834274.2 aspartyl protease family protein 2 [Cryptomeria japonica]GLJ08643.1 hypothetical protein SUGI_0092830 [Cryptomeria japonica]